MVGGVVHTENPSWTCFEQDASLDIKSFFGFESTVEKIAMKQYTINIKKGKEVIEYYINELIMEGVNHIPPWSEPETGAKPALEDGEKEEGKETCDRTDDKNDDDSSLNLGATAATLKAGEERWSITTDIPEGKLDDEYIKRYLGELTPYEESKLVLLRRWLQASHKGKIPKDVHILRFLKARDFSLEKTREMMCHSLAWRKLHGIDRLLDTYQASAVLQEFWTGGWHYSDKDGRPMYILRLGQMDVKGLIRSVGEEAILKHVLAISEECLKRCEEATRLRGYPITHCTAIVDLYGLSMRHLWRPGIRMLLRIIEVVEANYPETMGYLLIVRAPRVFPVLWTLVSPFIDENTRNKFLIYGGKDYLGPGGLVDYMDKQYIPDFLNGDCFCNVPDGGLVPKSLYLPDDDLDKCADEIPLGVDSLYLTSYVVKDYPHEVLVQVPQRGCVITWDFDILKGDVTFSILRSRKPLSSDRHEHHLSGATAGPTSTQYLDRHWTVGVHVSIIEPPLVCRDGDSIQGSHVTSQSGSYILQWKHFDSTKGSFDILTSHKSKVMYYTELLASDKFRGSMSSLHSCQSQFSSLSLTNSLSSQSCVLGSSHPSCPSR